MSDTQAAAMIESMATDILDSIMRDVNEIDINGAAKVLAHLVTLTALCGTKHAEGTDLDEITAITAGIVYSLGNQAMNHPVIGPLMRRTIQEYNRRHQTGSAS